MSLLTNAEDFSGLQFSDPRTAILDATLPSNPSRSLLFIDSGVVDDVQTLVNGALGAEVHLLRLGADAMAQITQTLLGRSGIESLQIVSHGRSGGLKLGAGWLDLQSLPSYLGQLKSWGQALTAEADVLLYGCDVGQGESGNAFVNLLAQATGADVAASDDLTGNGALGGDWDLEVRSGRIEAVGLVVGDYRAVLASFAGSTNVGVGTYPSSVTLGDVNGDGKLDLLTANSNSNNVSVRLGDGLGGFTGSTNVGVGTYPSSVTLGDVNGDGKLDLLTANSISNDVSVRLGDGLGGFRGSTNVGVGTYPKSVMLGDVNGDGKLDLLTANTMSNDVSVRLGDGLGNFTGSANVGVVLSPYFITLGDVNGDGKLDLLTANNGSNDVSVRLGDGLGDFTGSVNVGSDIDLSPQSVTLGDVNGDGKLDLLTAHSTSNNVSVRLGDGLGGFTKSTSVGVGRAPSAITLGDVNGDGKFDLITANVTSNDVSVRLGDGLGGFTGSLDIGVGSLPFSVTLGDVNEDGKLDLIVANYGSSNVSVLLNTTPTVTVSAGTAPVEEVSNGSFTIALDQPAPVGGLVVNYSLGGTATVGADYSLSQTASTNITAIAPGSFTIAAGQTTATIAVIIVKDGIVDPNETIGLNILNGDYFRDSATPRFIAASTPDVAVGGVPTSSALGDVNGDGKLDLLTTNASSNDVSVQLGDGLGGFAGNTKVVAGPSPSSITLGDVNRDGKLDFLTVSQGNNDRSGLVSVRLGDGMGGFSGTTDIAIGSVLRSLALGDVNGDGKLDFLTADSSSNTVLVRLGDGLGGFSGSTNVAVGPFPFSVTLGDVNRDGKLDLLTANNSRDSGSVSVRLGDGLGGFSGSTNVDVGPFPIFVTLGDVNRDGKLDFLTAHSNREVAVSVRLGDGLGGFSGTTDVAVGLQPVNLALGDVNGDGKLDLLAANAGFGPSGSNDVSLRLGDGLGGFSGTTNVVTGFNPRSVLLADVNRDGKLDFLATNLVSNTVSVRLNQPGADLVIGESVQRPQADLLLRNPSAGEVRILGLNKNQIAVSEAPQLANGTVVTPDADWKLISGKSDFNGDSIRDFVWFNTVTGESAIWYMQKGSTGLSNIIGSASLVYLPNAQKSFQVGSGWQLTAVENLLGDSRPEFLWEDRGTGSTAIWQLDIASNSRTDINLTGSAFVTLNGATIQTGGTVSGWRIAGLGSFTVNSSTKDILWFNERTFETAVWQLDGTAIVGSGFVNSLGKPLTPVGWRPVAIANLDGVGPDEIVWQSGTAVAVWNLGSNYEVTNRSVVLSQGLAAGEQVQALADLNLDGSLDLVVRQKASDVGGISIYSLNKTTFQLAIPTQFLVQPPATTAYSTGDRRFDIVDAVDLGGPLVTPNLA
jgi:Domain of unknown function (DUF4347)/FG-GAP-like repeat